MERPPQPKDPSEPVWRYMDLAKYVDLLARKKLHLRRVDRFDDPFEATLPEGMQRKREYLKRLREARQRTYVSCWRLGRDESEAMWKLYCGSAGGIAIALPYGDLASSARETGCRIGLVRYIDYHEESFPDAMDIAHASLYKRVAFEHEREVRLVRKLPGRRNPKSPPEGVDIDWDPERWVDKVVLSPLSEDYFRASVHKVTEALAPKLARRFARSQMRHRPVI